MAGSMGWLEKKKIQGAVVVDYLKPFKKLFGVPFLPVTWPLRQAYKLGYAGLSHAVDGVEWTGHALKEAAKGTFQTAVSPFLMLAQSRLTTVKRFLWDVPIATVSAALRTPIALAKSPLEMVRGVRDAITSIPGNAMDIFNNLRQFKLMDAMQSTRKAVTDVIVPPFSRPIKPILAPTANIIGTALGAEFQTATVLKQAITETIPEGGRRVWHAPRTATGIMAQVKQERAIKKAVLEKEKNEAKERLEDMVAEEKGLPKPNADKAKKKAA